MRLALGRLFGYVTVMVIFAFNAVRTVLDLIGYSTAPSDAVGVPAVLQSVLAAMLSVPWWAGWGVFVLCFFWITWLAFSPQPSAHAPSGNTLSGRGTPFEIDVPRHRHGDSLLVSMQKATRSFQTMVENLSEGDRPSTLPAWKAFTAHMVSVQLSMEKFGLAPPWLNPETDPLGWMERNAEYFNRVTPMVAAGHIDEAKATAKGLVAKLQNEHTGPNGREALQ